MIRALIALLVAIVLAACDLPTEASNNNSPVIGSGVGT